MSRARELSRLGNPNIIQADSEFNVGFGTLTPRAKGDFVGVVSATSFYGDGSTLTGVAAAGIGTALSEEKTSPLNNLFYTNQAYTVGVSTTIDPPTSGSLGYSQASEIIVADSVDLTVADGDVFMVDVLGITTDPLVGASVDNNYLFSTIYADNITNQAGTGAPDASQGFKISKTTESTNSITGALIVSGGVGIAKSLHVGGNVSVAGTLTYEDVTNQDVLGIATYRSGVKFGVAGVGGTITAAGNAEFTGVCTATSFSGDGSGLSGIDAAPVASGIASGSIASGAAVALADDGKFMTVTGTNSSYGAAAVADSNALGNQHGGIAYDSANNKVVMVYREASVDKGWARVGSISGTTITWGSRVQFSTTTCAYPNVCFDSNAEKVVITMRDEGGRGDAVVGTVSGTSISFGSVTNFESSTNVWRHACAFDSTTNKVVIGYIDNPSSWSIRAIVGTVSGTSISFGTAVTGGAAGSGDTPRMVCDNGVATITYNTKVVGATISGTSVSFGTAQTQTWGDGNTLCNYVPIAYDPLSGKYLLTGYKDESADSPFVRSMTRSGTVYTINDDVTVWSGSGENNTVSWAGQKDTFIVGNNRGTDGNDGLWTTIISTPGTSTVVGTPRMFSGDQSSSENSGLFSVYDPDSKAAVFWFRNSGDSNKAYYYVEKLRVSNGTVGAYVGLSNAAYTNGQTAKVAVTGAVSTNQTGLTTATRYYLAGDGTLSQSSDTEGVIVGQALSFTNLLLR